MKVPAVVAAGDRRAAKAIHGESKPYLEVGGRSLVEWAVSVLQAVPEVSEVWVVGDARRLGEALATESLQAELRKPLTVVPQFRNLYENAWQTYRRLLPGAGPLGRDPEGEDLEQSVLYLSADLPFATPEEISAFIRQSLAMGGDYHLGLVSEESMEPYYPCEGKPGIRMAYFNLREGRLRQSNLHLVKPAKLGHRHYIEEMYEHRYQRQLGQMLALGWRVLTGEGGGLGTLWAYALIHLAGVLDRRGFRRLADRLRWYIPGERVERTVGRLLKTDFRLVVTEGGGCGLDVDNDEDYDTAVARFEEWREMQERRVASLYGKLALAERTAEVPPLRIVSGGES